MGAKEQVDEAIDALGYKDFDAFLLEHTGYTLTEMAEILDLPTQTFVTYHNEWVDQHAPPLWED